MGAGVFDTGAVGGALTDFKGAGRRVAAMALRVMAGEKVPVDPDASQPLTRLNHWNLLRRCATGNCPNPVFLKGPW